MAGTRVYEDKRQESVKVIEETGNHFPLLFPLSSPGPLMVPPFLFHEISEQKREKINEYLGQIDERLQELEAEKKELSSFAELDSKRRALEYAIYAREDSEVTTKLKEVGGSDLTSVLTEQGTHPYFLLL